MGLLGSQVEAGVIDGEPLHLLISALPFQFYSILAIIYVGFTIFSGKEWGPMKKAEARAAERAKNGDAAVDLKKLKEMDESYIPTKEGITPKALNMIVPILLLVGSIFLFFLITGNGHIRNGDGTSSVYWGVFTTILLTGVLYLAQKLCSVKEYITWCINGMKNVLYVVIILTCAFAIGNILWELGTGSFLAGLVGGKLNPGFVPVVAFILTCFMSFATGSSGGATSVFIPVALPFAVALGAPVVPTIGAVVSGAVFGDHCSPISDTTILSSMIAGCEHMDHYKTQIFYAMSVGIVSLVFYIAFGFIIA